VPPQHPLNGAPVDTKLLGQGARPIACSVGIDKSHDIDG
jgi:hypothetical protein